MNLIKKKLITTATLLFAMAIMLAAQPNIALNYQGILTDGEGREIGNEKFDLSVKLMSGDPSKSVLWTYNASSGTNEDGWFSFSVPDISNYLMDGNAVKEPVVIQLDFAPNQQTRWMKPGEDFMVTYTLTPSLKDNAIHLKMSRMEGSELEMHLEDHLYAFKDEYPFAYLTGGFLLSDAPPIDANSMGDLRQWISPDPTVSGASTRGVKGGFPKGGYRKKN
jgi:hypothetical protein